MPTTKPRINLTLRPTLAATIRRLSELQGNSMSKTIVDLLEVAEPALQRTAMAIEAVRNLEGEAKTSMLAQVLAELRHLEELQLSATGQPDMFTEMERKTLEAVERKASGAKRAPSDWEELQAERTRIENECLDDIIRARVNREPRRKRRRGVKRAKPK